MERYFVVVNAESSPKELVLGEDVFSRPMPWGIWLSAVIGADGKKWQFARVIGVADLSEHQLAIEDGRLLIDDIPFVLETPNIRLVVLWAVESVYYGTSLKVWNWPVSRRLFGKK